MVTGGDALVEVSGASVDSLQISLNGEPLENFFRKGVESGNAIVRIDELIAGKNTLEVEADDRTTRIELMNHPKTGPVFSGPHQMPFFCETERAGLGPPLDDHCSVETQVDYYYKSTESSAEEETANRQLGIPTGYKVFDPSVPRPADLARTTITTGKTVDFIVRRETGTINRAIYQIAFLHEPGSVLPEPGLRSDGWNGRLVYRFGGGCRAGYRQGRLSSALIERLLSKGYAVAASSLNVFGNNCDDVVSAETLMMVKEHFIESFGVPVHTIGSGGSGGSMQQHLIAQNYPGLLDGITPTASYSDIVTLVPSVTDCSLLANAFARSKLEWSSEQKTAVSGFATWNTCESWIRSNYSHGWIRPEACDSVVPTDEVYDSKLNPNGVRCGLHDNQKNVYGRNPDSGLTLRTLDNVGVQYGLTAFNEGEISPEQFLELNENIGGYDADGNIVSSRSVADLQALGTAYRTGRVNSGGGSLGLIPIIDARRYVDREGNIHDRIRTFVTEARLARANGDSNNRVILTNHGTDIDPIQLMDEWLTKVKQDKAEGTVREKVIRNKPTDLQNACWTSDDERIMDEGNDSGRCSELFKSYGDPRIAAGAPLTNDVLKCELKPIDSREYKQPLSDSQLDRLGAIFSYGVCDYSRPSVGQQSIAGTWLDY